jgi:hypothetical protein
MAVKNVHQTGGDLIICLTKEFLLVLTLDHLYIVVSIQVCSQVVLFPEGLSFY